MTVQVHLLAVRGQTEADEDRGQRWATPAEATRLLAEGRKPRYAEEFARVIRLGVAALGRGV